MQQGLQACVPVAGSLGLDKDSLNRELAKRCLQPIMMALREITDPTLASDTSADSIGFGYIVMFEGEQIAGS